MPSRRQDVRQRGHRDERAVPRLRPARGVPRHRYAEHGPAGPADVLHGIALRLRWRRLVERRGDRFPLGVLALVNGVVSIDLLAAAAALTRQPLVFPSLGPTAFLLFYRPHAEVACPRNALAGHLIGAAAGLCSLTAFGLIHHGPALHHVTGARIGAAGLSLGLTAAIMIWTATPHPPAGATTLIVSLGFLDTPEAVGILLAGVALLVLQGFAVNRWAGIDYPAWGPHRPPRPAPSSPQRGERPDAATAASRPVRGRGDAMRFNIYVDVDGSTPLDPAAAARLAELLGPEARELRCTPHGWTGVLSVDAVDVDEAATVVRARIHAADDAAGLGGWNCRCWEIREQLVGLDDETAPWHPHVVWRHPHLPHRRAEVQQ